jgi:hypothetical protein
MDPPKYLEQFGPPPVDPTIRIDGGDAIRITTDLDLPLQPTVLCESPWVIDL